MCRFAVGLGLEADSKGSMFRSGAPEEKSWWGKDVGLLVMLVTPLQSGRPL